MHYYIDIIPSSQLFVFSAMVSLYISKNPVWITLNIMLPAISYYSSIDPDNKDDDDDEYDILYIKQNKHKMGYLITYALSTLYICPWMSWSVLPASAALLALCNLYSDVNLCRDVLIIIALAKLVIRSYVVLPLAMVAYVAHRDSLLVQIEENSIHRKMVQLHWRFCITVILCIASRFI
jgi:hypothetical protein